MVRRRRKATVKRVKVGGKTYACKPTKASTAKYKKCILSAIRGTKITTRTGAQKAFRAAAKKCGKLYLAGVKARKVGRRKKKTRRFPKLPGMRSIGRMSTRMPKYKRQQAQAAGLGRYGY